MKLDCAPTRGQARMAASSDDTANTCAREEQPAPAETHSPAPFPSSQPSYQRGTHRVLRRRSAHVHIGMHAVGIFVCRSSLESSEIGSMESERVLTGIFYLILNCVPLRDPSTRECFACCCAPFCSSDQVFGGM